MRPDDLDSLRRRACDAANSADIELAISLFGEALAHCSNEDASTVLANMSLLYHQREEWNKALLYANQAMQAWPGNVKACFRAGMALLRLQQPAAACASFSAGLQSVPGHRRLLSALSEAQSQLRQESRVRTCPANLPGLPDAQLSSAQVAVRLEDIWFDGCCGQSEEVARRLGEFCQLHQHSLRCKGWYESHQEKNATPSQLLTESAVDVEMYSVLHVASGATLTDVRAAYRRMVLAAHPDKGGSVDTFARVQQAYRLLTASSCSTTCGNTSRLHGS